MTKKNYPYSTLFPSPLHTSIESYEVIDPAVQYVKNERKLNNEDELDQKLFEKLKREHDSRQQSTR